MNLIEKLGLEKCKQIVDGAPKTATHYNMNILGGHYAREGVLKMKTQWEWFNTINKEWYFDFAEHNHIALLDLRAALADHNKCQHEWNETTSNGDKYRFFVCKHCDSARNFIPLDGDITDYVTDIKNHISPTTVVIER